MTGKIVSHVSGMAHALYKAKNPVTDGFYIIISSLNDVLKLRHSAQQYSRAYSCISLRWTTCAGRRVGGRRGGGCNTCVCALKEHDYAKYSVSAVVIMGK